MKSTILTVIKIHTKLLLSELQNGWKWNPMRMDWHTNEDFIDTEKKINHRLIKYSASDLIANMPIQFTRLDLRNLNDTKMLTAACEQPMKLMVTHNRISSANAWGHKRDKNDPKSTPFMILEVPSCRRVMMKQIHSTYTDEKNNMIKENKRRHLENCNTCFKVFRMGLSLN